MVSPFTRILTRKKADEAFSWISDMSRYDVQRISPEAEHRMICPEMEVRYPRSPPRTPVDGATDTDQDTVKVMAYHGIVYSHGGLSDPAL